MTRHPAPRHDSRAPVHAPAGSERGIALVLALFLVSALSVLAGSLMFLSQTETYASMNYRMMSQARYGAEAGVQKAANFLLTSTSYGAPGTATGNAADTIALYKRDASPVTCISGCAVTGTNAAATPSPQVVLSATTGVASNYPVAAVSTAFSNAAQGTLTAGNMTISYSAVAKLVSMQTFESYGGGTSVVQTWEVTGTGTLSGSRNATVEVVALVETPKVPASTYGAFATDNTCGALNFSGNVTINSYDSTNLTGTTTPTTSASGGDVGTNGNLTISGSVDVQGNLYTPRTGVGSCTQGSVSALTESGNANVTGSIVQLPTTVVYPTPPVPAQSPLPAVGISSVSAATCTALGLTIYDATTNPTGQCKYDSAAKTIEINGYGSPLTLPSVSLSSSVKITMVGGSPASTYNFNSISTAGSAAIAVKATSNTQSAIVNIVGKNPDGSAIATPLDFAGGSFASPDISGCSNCSRYDASLLQILYAGTGTINLVGNSAAAATVYAPNATANVNGTADIYGSLLAKRLSNNGNANIHYDRRLQRDYFVAGNPVASTFTWKRY